MPLNKETKPNQTKISKLKSLYDDIISAVDDFFLTSGIQKLQHQWKKHVGWKKNYVEK